jgi:hypothetical protein
LKTKVGQSEPEDLQNYRNELEKVELDIGRWKDAQQEKKERRGAGYDARMNADIEAGHSVYQSYRKKKSRERTAMMRMAEQQERSRHQRNLHNRWYEWYDEQEVTEKMKLVK